jgi:hypothetical protein
MQASATAGAAIILLDDRGVEQLRVACRVGPADLHVAAPVFEMIESEERFTLGAGSELATLVVSPEIPSGRGVEATGPLPPAFIDAVAEGREIGASYGARQIGPMAAPPAEIRLAFAAACRASSLPDRTQPTP